MENTRRTFLTRGVSALGAAVLLKPVPRALAQACGLTPAQTEGPFYPGEELFHADNDLTRVPGRTQLAQGKIIYLHGQVLDPLCRPIDGATVEIWQACASGRYNNPKDPNTAPLDPNFKYWGECYTNANGEYSFKTIEPGAYPADTNWMRPPHIHFKVSRIGYHELTTQMYFKGNEYNDADLILKGTPAATRPSLIVDFQPAGPGFESDARAGKFDLTLQPVRSSAR